MRKLIDAISVESARQVDPTASTVDEAGAVAIHRDGRIAAAGGTRDPSLPDSLNFALARYKPDGSLDTVFGGGGKVTTDFASRYDAALALAIQKDGRIVAAGFATLPSTDRAFALARYKVCRPTSRRPSIPC